MNWAPCMLREKAFHKTTRRPSNGSERQRNRATRTLNLILVLAIFSVPALTAIWKPPHTGSLKPRSKVTRALQIRLGECPFSATACQQAKRRPQNGFALRLRRSEGRRVGKECRSRWSPYH